MGPWDVLGIIFYRPAFILYILYNYTNCCSTSVVSVHMSMSPGPRILLKETTCPRRRLVVSSSRRLVVSSSRRLVVVFSTRHHPGALRVGLGALPAHSEVFSTRHHPGALRVRPGAIPAHLPGLYSLRPPGADLV